MIFINKFYPRETKYDYASILYKTRPSDEDVATVIERAGDAQKLAQQLQNVDRNLRQAVEQAKMSDLVEYGAQHELLSEALNRVNQQTTAEQKALSQVAANMFFIQDIASKIDDAIKNKDPKNELQKLASAHEQYVNDFRNSDFVNSLASSSKIRAFVGAHSDLGVFLNNMNSKGIRLNEIADNDKNRLSKLFRRKKTPHAQDIDHYLKSRAYRANL